MTTPTEAENSLAAAVGEPPAGPFSFWGGVWQKLQQWDNWSLEKKYGRRTPDGSDVDDENPEIHLMEETLSGRSFDEMTGLERLRCIYFREYGYEAVEWELTKRATVAAGLSGFLIGGLLGQKMTAERFDKYAVGRDFGNLRNAVRRKLDYTVLMFAKNGLFSALRIGLIGGLSVWTVVNVSTYRNKYCSYYSPLACSTFSAILTARNGAAGMAMGFGMGFMPGVGLSAMILAYSLYNGLGANAGYWQLRERLSEELRERRVYKEKVRRVMRDENIWLKMYAEHRLAEIEAAEQQNALEEKSELEGLGGPKKSSELERFSDGEREDEETRSR